MFTISGKAIRDAAVFGKEYFTFYKSHIKTDKNTGFAIEFETFGDLADFLVRLGADAFYNENRNSMSPIAITQDEAAQLARSLEVDPFGNRGLLAFFPGWELDGS